MNQIRTIFKASFRYKGAAIATIIFNLLYVIFNIISLVLFVPFLQLIFPTEADETAKISEPILGEGFSGFFEYLGNSYQYFMQEMVADNPKGALLFVCCSVLIAFFLKNFFRFNVPFSFVSSINFGHIRAANKKPGVTD